MNYPDKEALIDMALNTFEDHLLYLRAKMPEMTKDQRQAFIRICASIASMDQKEAA